MHIYDTTDACIASSAEVGGVARFKFITYLAIYLGNQILGRFQRLISNNTLFIYYTIVLIFMCKILTQFVML